MRLTIGRWVAAILASCALVAVVLLPIPRNTKSSWVAQYPQALSSSGEALMAAAADRNDAVRDYRVAQALARWKANRGGDVVQIDASTPPPVAQFMRTVAQEQWRRVGNTASASHATVFVYFDSSTIAASSSPNARRTAEPNRPADVWYALPEITDGERCVVLVRVRVATAQQLAHLRERSLLGPCAYFAAFGKPGPAINRWLEATNYRPAIVPDWDRPRAPAVDASAVYSLDEAARPCLTGAPNGCAIALGRQAVPRADAHLVDGNSSGEARKQQTMFLGGASAHLLADAVRELGQPRFAQFWTSTAPLDSAFATTAGVSLDKWTAQWLERSYGAARGGPAVRVSDVLWLTILSLLLIRIAASRRERLLTERFRLAASRTT